MTETRQISIYQVDLSDVFGEDYPRVIEERKKNTELLEFIKKHGNEEGLIQLRDELQSTSNAWNNWVSSFPNHARFLEIRNTANSEPEYPGHKELIETARQTLPSTASIIGLKSTMFSPRMPEYYDNNRESLKETGMSDQEIDSHRELSRGFQIKGHIDSIVGSINLIKSRTGLS